MIHQCNYYNYQSGYKSNLKTHVKNQHVEKISLEKDQGKPDHKELRKLKMLVKKFAIMGVDLRLKKRHVDTLVDRVENDFNLIVQDYEKLTHQPLQIFGDGSHPILTSFRVSVCVCVCVSVCSKFCTKFQLPPPHRLCRSSLPLISKIELFYSQTGHLSIGHNFHFQLGRHWPPQGGLQ